MTIQSIHGYAMPTVAPSPGRAPATHGPDTASSQGLAPTRTVQPQPAHAVGRRADAVPMDAPAGTDPMLWSVLTTEERSFFARARSMGQLTYGPGVRNSASSLPSGGRIDVRV